MRESRRRHIAGSDDDARSHLGPVPHLDGKRHRHADAAMRGGMARQDASMHGNAGPSDPLHVGHGRAAIDVGMMKPMLLNYAENAHRRWVARHARGNRCFRKQPVSVVNPDLLLSDRNRDDQRPLRFSALLLGNLGFLVGLAANALMVLQSRWRWSPKGGIRFWPIIDRRPGLRG